MPFIQELPYVAQNVTSVTTFAIDLSSIRAKNSRSVAAEVEVTGANVTVKFGFNSGVAASYTITGNTFPEGNYHCTAGTVKTLNVPAAATHFSICPIAGGTAQVAINFGFERD